MPPADEQASLWKLIARLQWKLIPALHRKHLQLSAGGTPLKLSLFVVTPSATVNLVDEWADLGVPQQCVQSTTKPWTGFETQC
jgi:hypothetical protein